jgi:hypothetical protein
MPLKTADELRMTCKPVIGVLQIPLKSCLDLGTLCRVVRILVEQPMTISEKSCTNSEPKSPWSAVRRLTRLAWK